MTGTEKPCKYCKKVQETVESYKCDTCYALSHLVCMKCKKPSHLKGDFLFLYQCKDCNFQQKDSLTRMKLSWVQVIHLTLYNLTVVERGREGFFRWKEEICGFIEKHWSTLMPGRSKAPNWVGTIAGTLSVHSNTLFKSGQEIFNETGWWALQEVSIPKANPENYRISRVSKNSSSGSSAEPLQSKVDILNISAEYGRGKRQRKAKVKSHDELASAKKVQKIEQPPPKVKTIPLILPTKNFPSPVACVNTAKNKNKHNNIKRTEMANRKSPETLPKKPKHVENNNSFNQTEQPVNNDDLNAENEKKENDSEINTKETPNTAKQNGNTLKKEMNALSKQSKITDKKVHKKTVENFPTNSNCSIMAEMSSGSYGNNVQFDDPFAALFDDMSVFEMPSITSKELIQKDSDLVKYQTKKSPCKPPPETLPNASFKPLLKVKVESSDHDDSDTKSPTAHSTLERLNSIKPIEKSNNVKPLTIKEETEFLAKINDHPLTIESDCSVRRLRRKLLNRKLKRDIGLPLFRVHSNKSKSSLSDNIKSTEVMKENLKSLAEESMQSGNIIKQNLHHPALKDVNVLDKFVNYLPQNMKNLTARNSPRKKFIQLIGLDEDIYGYQNSIVSPYTARILKPYIRRDFTTLPPKLKILREIQKRCEVAMHTNWPIDYCYVQPMHIPAVNSLCSDFFWPGIDLTECLQYPEFSCVVLYRKLLIGFAFMVPDVKFNEAYISFILVHPDWRRSGIASNMIYHLIQTCMGKDITLHVSPSNPSMLLYQKFGFKAEALILDFYKKYMPEEDQNSKHAFLMRLQR